MKNSIVFLLVFITNHVIAQNISLSGDKILKGKTTYAIFKKSKTKPVRYFINSVDGKPLVEVHYSHLDLKNKPLYVVTFLQDHHQAMIARQAGFPGSFIKDVVKYNLITNGSLVNTNSEAQFINAHGMPMGYADVDQLIEY